MSSTIKTRNPRTGDFDYILQADDPGEIEKKTQTLRRNQPEWQSQGIEHRVQVLGQFAEGIQDNADAIVEALSIDTGRQAIAQGELQGLVGSIVRWIQVAPDLMRSSERNSAVLPHIAIQQQLTPFPVLGAISPWNFPLLLSFIDVTPALLAGCASLIKPSEVTPRFADPVEKVVESIPELAKVLAFVRGDGVAGAALIQHVDVVAFTGSVATGKKVAAAAAENFIPAFLELGGKDPVILLPGTDIERASTAILRASVSATGQACQSLERIYAHTSLHDDFVQELTLKAKSTPLSFPDPHSGIVGPLIFAKQGDIIRSHLADAVAKGAEVQCGGEVKELGGGLWVEPTVVTQVNHQMKLMSDETFGPIMPVMTFETTDEAVTLANDSEYGLSAAVMGATEGEALAVAKKINAGGVSINDAGLTTMIFEEQKSAFGYSGMGPSRMGASGLTRFFRNKALFLNRGDVLPVEAFQERGTK